MSLNHLAGTMFVALMSNQWAFTAMDTHLLISGNVFVFSCGSPFAATHTLDQSRVDTRKWANIP